MLRYAGMFGYPPFYPGMAAPIQQQQTSFAAFQTRAAYPVPPNLSTAMLPPGIQGSLDAK
jgi:hypothetical protein